MNMPESACKKKWDAENSRIFTVKFMRKTDQDVIDFLEKNNRRDAILAAVREYMANHPDEQED